MLRKAVAKHKDIGMKQIFDSNGDIAWRYIDIMESCFGVGACDEGFSLMGQVNSLLTSPSQSAKVKSMISEERLKRITANATKQAMRETEVQLIHEFHAKLSLGFSDTQHLEPLKSISQ